MNQTDCSQPNVVSLGGGHGLFQTLRAVRLLKPASINAVVTVADDGGSSGRIRRELGQIPPGDLRMALAALAPFDEEGALWEQALQHRFSGHGALAGHAVGNLLIAGLVEITGSELQSLDMVAKLMRTEGRVLPVCNEALEIAAEVGGLEDDPRIMREVRGQVAVASTPGTVRRVRVFPENPEPLPEALEAIAAADLITLGPGSWFSSVIPHVLVPGIPQAINNSNALRVVVLNLNPEPGETAGFSAERHLHVLSQHANGIQADVVLVDSSMLGNEVERKHLERAAAALGARVSCYDLRELDERGRTTDRHSPAKLADALRRELAGENGNGNA
ncbi:uridine diphosphate-N-acetylglucosamine-binding protein YvcK [Corynebacterium sp. 153RC1]|uniref:gluconeogenesis factor YvcK family protein n=1 Tax=unclassified Corynebacterium TaxID=2624378 RepID=UPI00211B8FD7|nr:MULTISPECIES: uridine diphosphate-N-acetylglucosamine-binding protein YvcK [unclassified Corynebacterium]MCQ9369711.1 uridine diphosphate-N-acetylglucosamine-binding protein YvcK [Corynebacterium sp. 35RC1]MCQ9351441.1 uridine diphosphate-N-acetylglucosamine-binding protein YvcK [Corynebacterium sp. 209RC1]MCQ9354570.1 uridine diphosphate-N-acetylglucosamine-binding protein YvcK [Corynebacterium sp. 1222RC1]MCQ9357373.1 uridine diphosphate-N-acetylglucosamine-binding protein YvcK [Corynebact